jgi:hypothetical protein
VIRILVLVHEDELKLPLIMFADRLVIAQQAEGLFEQVVEVERVRIAFLRLVLFPCPDELRRELEEMRILLNQDVVDAPPRVERKAEDVRR